MGGYTYEPFGTITTGSATTTTHAFQTEQKDPESNLIYLRARYYDPTTGRFLSKDPASGSIDYPVTQNGYNYAHNDPVNLSDPSGRAIPLAGILLVYGAAQTAVNVYDYYNTNWRYRDVTTQEEKDASLSRLAWDGVLSLSGAGAATKSQSLLIGALSATLDVMDTYFAPQVYKNINDNISQSQTAPPSPNTASPVCNVGSLASPR